MSVPLFVLGHRNPDTDSISSAIGYAALLNRQGYPEAVPGRQGTLRPETEWVLNRFGVPAPKLVTDVRPRVSDVMTSPPMHVHQEDSLYEAGQMLQRERIRTLPVVDARQRLLGVIGLQDLANAFVSDLDTEQLNYVPLDLSNVLRTLDGELLVPVQGRIVRDRVMVGAMRIESMLELLERDIMLVMGDREDAQRAAIEFGVGALVITGDLPVSEGILALARERGVIVISVPHHTYSTVRLLRLSTPVRYLMRTEAPTCSPDDLLEDVRERLVSAADRFLVVVEDDNTVVGLLSRSNLLRSVHRKIVLVDHNERGQSVEGIEDAEIVGVVDHHRVADFQTRAPLLMRVDPVGSTSTIVAQMFDDADVEIPQSVAGVLLSGILADTLLFNGPTTTLTDRRVAALLAERADVDPVELGTSILDLASDVSDRTAEELVTTDFKEFTVDDIRFGIGVVETTNALAVLDRREALFAAMSGERVKGFGCLLFAVIDIVHRCTTILIDGGEETVAEAFGVDLRDGHVIEVQGILSRKKNIVPLLPAIARGMAGR